MQDGKTQKNRLTKANFDFVQSIVTRCFDSLVQPHKTRPKFFTRLRQNRTSTTTTTPASQQTQINEQLFLAHKIRNGRVGYMGMSSESINALCVYLFSFFPLSNK